MFHVEHFRHMKDNTLDLRLPLIQQPSHYLGCEVNASRKDPRSAALHLLLAFPDLYEIGMSYQGLQIL